MATATIHVIDPELVSAADAKNIPAGQIGNELPINVVSERWYSPELKQLVMSLQSDPRFGVTTWSFSVDPRMPRR